MHPVLSTKQLSHLGTEYFPQRSETVKIHNSVETCFGFTVWRNFSTVLCFDIGLHLFLILCSFIKGKCNCQCYWIKIPNRHFVMHIANIKFAQKKNLNKKNHIIIIMKLTLSKCHVLQHGVWAWNWSNKHPYRNNWLGMLDCLSGSTSEFSITELKCPALTPFSLKHCCNLLGS